MSHAVVAAPILLTGGGLAALALTAAATIVVPMLIGAALGAIAEAKDATAAKERKRCAEAMHHELVSAINALKQAAGKADVSSHQRTLLQDHFSRLQKLPELISEKVGAGDLNHQDVAFVKEEMERYSQKITQFTAKLKESRRFKAFHEEQITKYMDQIESKYQGDPATLAELKKRKEELFALSEDDLETKVPLMADFSSRLSAMLDKLVMDKILGGLLGKSEEKKMAKPGSPTGPAPVSPSSGPDAMIKKLARLKKAQQEIEFYFRQLKETAPQTITANLEKLTEEATKSEFLERVLAIRDEVKMTYQKVHESAYLNTFFREKLSAALQVLAADSGLAGKIRQTLAGDLISREVYQTLFVEIETELVKIMERKRREIIEQKLKEGLSKLDYVVIDSGIEEDLATRLHQGKIVLLDTKYDDYKLMVRMSADDAVAIRLIRVVASDREKADVSEFQQKKDRELMTEWCKNLDVLKENIQQAGVLLVEQIRIEETVDYFTIEQLEQQQVDVSTLRKTGKTSAPVAQKRSRE